jgi:hypothetical protein
MWLTSLNDILRNLLYGNKSYTKVIEWINNLLEFGLSVVILAGKSDDVKFYPMEILHD